MREVKETRKLRAIIEIVDGRLAIYPIAQSDRERQEIITALVEAAAAAVEVER